MNAKKIALGAIGLAIILSTGALTASAYQGDYTVKGPNCTPERSEAMETAFETADYDAWLELMGDRGRVKDVVTEENFAQFAEAHQLAMDGDYEAAREIREELGLPGGKGERMGGMHRGGDRDGSGEGRGSWNK